MAGVLKVVGVRFRSSRVSERFRGALRISRASAHFQSLKYPHWSLLRADVRHLYPSCTKLQRKFRVWRYDLPKKLFFTSTKGVTWKFGIKLTWWMPTWCPVCESTNRIVQSHLMRPFLDNSVDVVLCDLPFGRQFGTLDTWRTVGTS